jgi:hypothetical protein
MSTKNIEQQLQSALATIAQLQQENQQLKQDNQQLKEENQQLKTKNEEAQEQLQILQVLRSEAEIEFTGGADDAAVQKSVEGCKFPMLTEKIDLYNRKKITDLSIARIVAAFPNVTELNLFFCKLLSDNCLQQISSLRNLKLCFLASNCSTTR